MSENQAEMKQSKGGIARAKLLTPEKRSEIAKKAAAARWGAATPTATHSGTLEIGGYNLPCAVLEDGTRIISETGIAQALGSRSGGSKRLKYQAIKDGRAPVPIFLAPKRLEPFINNELLDGPLKPIEYTSKNRISIGYDATALPEICDIWLRARDAGVLQAQQESRAKKAEILVRALAQVGIVALVDEATGYQEIRDRMALQAILDKYLRKELAAWAKAFPDEFYREMFRLRQWKWEGMQVKKPQVVGKYTNDIVYERIAPALVKELETRNPKNSKGRRRHKHHQWLSEDIGHPALAQHLHAVIGLMRASVSWDQFKTMLNRAFPKKGDTLEMPID